MCADDAVPHHQIEGDEQLQVGSEEEVEIRACTVVAVERLKDALQSKLQETVPGAADAALCCCL